MSYTEIDGSQIQDESITGEDIADGSIYRQDINTTSTGKALIRKVLSSTGLSISYTGVDLGTGDAILAVSTGYVSVVHRPLDQLVHAIAENSYYEIERSGNNVTKEIWWDSSEKTLKIREIEYSYSGNLVIKIVTKQYDSLGNVVVGETLTETITRTGVNVSSITSVLS